MTAANLRSIAALDLPDVVRAEVADGKPSFLAVDPRGLLVDEAYQRNLSRASLALIRRIVGGWDWKAFKPPIVVAVAGGYHVIDGQHTAIAAASIPSLKTIPVMVVDAASTHERATAFVMHNRDRVAITPTQIHFAMVAAGDEDALTIEQVCAKAGARIVKTQPYNGQYRVGDTMAISAVKGLVARRHAMGARRILQVCVKGGLAPVSVTHMRGVEHLLFSLEYVGKIDEEAIAEVIFRKGAELEKETSRFATEHDIPLWRAYASIIFRNVRKRRGASEHTA